MTEGDVFEFAVPDGRFGYGIIIKRGGLKNGGTPYIAIFKSLHDERPNFSDVVCEEIVLSGWTMDALFYHGRWHVVGKGIPLPLVPFPNFKVAIDGRFHVTDVEGNAIREAKAAELEILDYQFSRSPIGFQHAFEAIHGFRTWDRGDDKLTPAYALTRMSCPGSLN
ncbi:Imm26 family immunity protein [Blastomonas fulva]|uniref:Imm26 family immunity protein n=1 Tax=Blastomonas fulva TaxID=1550728 RepID=UPI003D2D2B15